MFDSLLSLILFARYYIQLRYGEKSWEANAMSEVTEKL